MTQIIGTIKRIFDTVQVNEKFSKRDLVVTTDDMYPQDLIMQFTQDKCNVLNGYNENERVTVDVNLRGREWISPTNEVKYFNTIEAWRITKDTGVPIQSPQADKNEPEHVPQTEEEDDLPF